MNRLLKWILMAAGAIVVVLIAAVVLIPLLVDVNEYKPQIEAQVEKATGRPLKIGGGHGAFRLSLDWRGPQRPAVGKPARFRGSSLLGRRPL